ncbi:MAG: TPM domain-containing protein, partial [Phenylobacterium sp.]
MTGRPGVASTWIGMALALLIPALALAAPTFPALTGRVVDKADLLSPEAEQTLEGRLKALEDSTGRQMVVVTIPDLQG